MSITRLGEPLVQAFAGLAQVPAYHGLPKPLPLRRRERKRKLLRVNVRMDLISPETGGQLQLPLGHSLRTLASWLVM